MKVRLDSLGKPGVLPSSPAPAAAPPPRRTETLAQPGTPHKSSAVPERTLLHPAPPPSLAQKAQYERDIERLRQSLVGQKSARDAAAKEALRLCSAYAARRSRGARRLAQDLLATLAAEAPDHAGEAIFLSQVLEAERELHELDPEGTARAARRFTELCDEEAAPELAALCRAGTARALVQLATHFPRESAVASLESADALAQALVLAEEAVQLAPELPDGHSALALVLLCSDEPEAHEAADEAIGRALALDPDHDPALAVRGARILEGGEPHEALELAQRLIRTGNALPHVVLHKGLALSRLGRHDEAARELKRAIAMAPQAGLLQLDAARVFAAAGSRELADLADAEARRLLGEAYERLAGCLR